MIHILNKGKIKRKIGKMYVKFFKKQMKKK